MLSIIEPRLDTLLPGRPIYTERIPAGFPSPAAGYEKQDLNLHEYCVRHPSATYFLRVEGNSMEDARIHDGDVLVFDECAPRPDSEALMNAVDRINRAGKGRMFFAGQGIDVGFAMRREMLSPEYTTNWNALPRAFMR